MPDRKTLQSVLLFIAALATAIALGGALAHAFELPNKIGLPRDQYFTVQVAYRGWNRLAYVLAVELVSLIALIIVAWNRARVFWPALVALVCLTAAQAIFWIFTFPANVATDNWTVVPDNWQALRGQWEYSHAAGAGFQLLAMSSLIVASLAHK